MAIFDYGFGVYMDRYTIDNKAKARIIEILPEDQKKDLMDFWEETHENGETLEDLLMDWAEDSFAWPVSELFAEIINEKEFNGNDWLRGDENILFMTPWFPIEGIPMPTQKMLEDAFKKYLGHVFEGQEQQMPRYMLLEEL